MIDGVTSITGTPTNLDADVIVVNGPLELTEPRYLQRIVAYLDGLGSSDTPQLIRGVLYQNRELVADGDVIQIQANQPGGWVPLTFADATGLALKPGAYQYGIHAGPTAHSIRMLIVDGDTPPANVFIDFPFSTPVPSLELLPSPHLLPGPDVIPGGGTELDGPIVAYLETLQGFSVPVDALADDYLAGLPMPLAQRIFTQGAPLTRTLLATAGWYGSAFDETQGSNAVVRSDGPLAELVGERLQIQIAGPQDRSVVVYVHDMAEFPSGIAGEDLVLSQRAFLQIANLGDDDARVKVTVMS